MSGRVALELRGGGGGTFFGPYFTQMWNPFWQDIKCNDREGTPLQMFIKRFLKSVVSRGCRGLVLAPSLTLTTTILQR
eukprot:6484181-Amphidinium_carterae.1